MSTNIHNLHLQQFDGRVKQWWADELTDTELDLIANRACTVAQVLQERSRSACSPALQTRLQRLCGKLAGLLMRRGLFVSKNGTWCLMIVIASIALFLLSLVGIVTMTGLFAGTGVNGDGTRLSTVEAIAQVASACGTCGVVESVRPIEVIREVSRAGATMSRGAYAGNEIEESMDKSLRYHILVRMDDGTYWSLSESFQPAVAAGQRVKIENGIAVSRSSISPQAVRIMRLTKA